MTENREQRRINEKKDAEFQKRLEPFTKELQQLSFKYKVNIVGALDYQRSGVVPVLAFIDASEEYGKVVKPKKDGILVK